MSRVEALAAPPQPLELPVEPARLLSAEREVLLARLAADRDHAGRVREPAREALRRVLEDTTLVTLRQTLETAATRGSLGAITAAVGLETLLELGRAKGLNVNDVLATTDAVTVRGLTTFEAERVRENFGGTLEPSTVRLTFTRGVQTMGAAALAVGNSVNIDPTDRRWTLKPGTTLPRDPRDESWNGYNSVVLAHEASHVWSYQHLGSAYATASVHQQLDAIASTGNRGGAYHYTPGAHPHFLDYGEEQRAMMVQDYHAARQAQRAGRKTSPTSWSGPKPVGEVLATLEPYLRELRLAGPGQPTPPPTLGAGGRTVTPRGFTQDGVAGNLGREADALVAAAGEASTRALLDGVRAGDLGQLALGVLGAGAAVGASLVSREQNDTAGGGGSAILDQAGIPHGVSVRRAGVSAELEAGWSAPAPRPGQLLSVGVKDPRVEAAVAVEGDVGDWQASARADASVSQAGLREAGIEGRLAGPAGVAVAAARLWPRAADAPLRATARLGVTTPEASASASVEVTAAGAQVRSLSLDAQLEARRIAASVQASWASDGGPLAFTGGAAAVGVEAAPGIHLAARTALLPAGVEAVELSVATHAGEADLAVAGSARGLTTAAPAFGGSLSVGGPQGRVALSGEHRPATGERQATLSVVVPIP